VVGHAELPEGVVAVAGFDVARPAAQDEPARVGVGVEDSRLADEDTIGESVPIVVNC
jgi:hypothetical protein